MRLLLVLVLLVLAACRDYSLAPMPTPELRPVGGPCESDAVCENGRCRDGFCCEADCAQSEVCNADKREGLCTARPAGSPCATPADCPSKQCTSTPRLKKFCCDRACLPFEACDLPGHEGTCTPVPLGTACASDDQCPEGSPCVDGVCCEAACEGDCRSCAFPGALGTCTSVGDNTDPRARCGLCGACFEGFCGPAEAGTDPKQECPGVQVCSPGSTCGLPSGEACATDAQCAVGECVLARCRTAVKERVFADGMEAAPTYVRVTGIAADDSGDVAIGVRSDVTSTSGSTTTFYAKDHSTVVRSKAGWALVDQTWIDDPRAYNDNAADLAFWNHRLYQAVFQPCTAASCGIVGSAFSSIYDAGPHEAIRAAGKDLDNLRLVVDGRQRLWAAWGDKESVGFKAYVARRDTGPDGPRWSPVTSRATDRNVWDVAALRDTVYLATFEQAGTSAAKVALLDAETGADVDSLELPCALDYPAYDRSLGRLRLGSYSDGGVDEGLTVYALCRASPGSSTAHLYLITWSPALPAGERWTTTSRPELWGVLPLKGARLPAFVVSVSSLVWDQIDLALTWRSQGTWSTKTVLASKATRAVWGLVATTDPSGAPVIACTVTEQISGTTIAPTDVDLLRFR